MRHPRDAKIEVRAQGGAAAGYRDHYAAARHGVVYLPRDRRSTGIFPVLSVLDNPEFYFELDAAPTGAMWGGLSDNPRGNASKCVVTHFAARGPKGREEPWRRAAAGAAGAL